MAVSGWSECKRCHLSVPDYLLPTGHICVPSPRKPGFPQPNES